MDRENRPVEDNFLLQPSGLWFWGVHVDLDAGNVQIFDEF